jgi:hypothetical protein
MPHSLGRRSGKKNDKFFFFKPRVDHSIVRKRLNLPRISPEKKINDGLDQGKI